MGTKEKEKEKIENVDGIGRDLERLIPTSATPPIPDHSLLIGGSVATPPTLVNGGSELSSPAVSSSHRHTGKEVLHLYHSCILLNLGKAYTDTYSSMHVKFSTLFNFAVRFNLQIFLTYNKKFCFLDYIYCFSVRFKNYILCIRMP